MSEQSGYRFLPAQFAERLRGIEVNVRRPMDGSRQGMHKSQAFGSSVEFAEYREYMPGDPITRIDWPVYARSDRYVIRRYHEDVSIRCYVLLDTSASMGFGGETGMTKLEYGCHLAAGLMYTMVSQGDTASLITFSGMVDKHYEPTGSLVGLRPMLLGLEELQAGGDGDIEASIHSAVGMIKGKALVIVISDLLQDPRRVMSSVHHLYHEGKDVTVFHVLDHGELTLPYTGLADVIDMESGQKMLVDFEQVRDAYVREVNRYLDEIHRACQNIRTDYVMCDTRQPAYEAIVQRSRMV
jgi:uncharacterized protein (DUF58 family)